jgi:signal transduction histidine kinase
MNCAKNHNGISQIPQAELNALLHENRELRAANRDLEVVAYAIAHDLRAPLRTIGGYAQLVAGEFRSALPHTVTENLTRIQTTVDHMQSMLGQWLSLVHKQHAILQVQGIDFSSLAESVAQELRIAHPERHVTVNIQPALTANADEVLLRELLQNLLGNAWKFTQQQGDARIDVGAYRDRDRMVYFVRDNGVGFPELDRERLFEPFVRLHQDRCYSGTGVGLAIAHRIVERHDGRIWAHALPDIGATFKFTLGTRTP